MPNPNFGPKSWKKNKVVLGEYLEPEETKWETSEKYHEVRFAARFAPIDKHEKKLISFNAFAADLFI